jgi:hypothetical protein
MSHPSDENPVSKAKPGSLLGRRIAAFGNKPSQNPVLSSGLETVVKADGFKERDQSVDLTVEELPKADGNNRREQGRQGTAATVACTFRPSIRRAP